MHVSIRYVLNAVNVHLLYVLFTKVYANISDAKCGAAVAHLAKESVNMMCPRNVPLSAFN